MLRPLIKILTSGELIERLDKNKNGRIEWSELRSLSKGEIITISLEIIIKYAGYLIYTKIEEWL